MAAPHLGSEVFYIRLLEIDTRVIAGSTYGMLRFQGQYPGVYTFNALAYNYLSFSIGGVERNMDLENSMVKLSCPNHPLIRIPMKQLDGLRQCPVTIITVFPNTPDGAPYYERMEVAAPSIQGAAIHFKLKSPLDGLKGRLPSRFYNNDDFPELPVVNSPAFG